MNQGRDRLLADATLLCKALRDTFSVFSAAGFAAVTELSGLPGEAAAHVAQLTAISALAGIALHITGEVVGSSCSDQN